MNNIIETIRSNLPKAKISTIPSEYCGIIGYYLVIKLDFLNHIRIYLNKQHDNSYTLAIEIKQFIDSYRVKETDGWNEFKDELMKHVNNHFSRKEQRKDELRDKILSFPMGITSKIR